MKHRNRPWFARSRDRFFEPRHAFTPFLTIGCYIICILIEIWDD